MSDTELVSLLQSLIVDIQENRCEGETKRELYDTIRSLISNEDDDDDGGWNRLAYTYLIRGWYLSHLMGDPDAEHQDVNTCPLCLTSRNNDI